MEQLFKRKFEKVKFLRGNHYFTRLINEQLRMDWNKVLMDKEHIATEKSNILSELKAS